MLNRIVLAAAIPLALFVQGCGAEAPSTTHGLTSPPSYATQGTPDLSSYYAGASSKSGEELRVMLHDIIKEHKFYSYDQVWEILKDTDEDPENTDNVIMFYTGESRSKDGQASSEASSEPAGRWNREHVWAKSKGFPRAGMTPYTDVHHLRACDVKLNSTRSNKYFAQVTGGEQVSPQGNKVGGNFFEPAKEFRGDVARMILYMDVRYEGGEYQEPELIVSDELGGDGVEEGTARFGKLSDLLRWNEEDPVDERERARNEKVFKWQKNRNPFIDHPEWANKIWGAK